jgi:hypothetical protein
VLLFVSERDSCEELHFLQFGASLDIALSVRARGLTTILLAGRLGAGDKHNSYREVPFFSPCDSFYGVAPRGKFTDQNQNPR